MKRNIQDGSVSRKIVTLKNFDLINGFVKDMVEVQDSNDSAVIEGILLEHIMPISQTSLASKYYINQIYTNGLKETVILLLQNLAGETQKSESYNKAYPLITLIMGILNRPFGSEVDEQYKHLLEDHFPSNCKAVSEKLEYETKDMQLTFDEKQRLKDDLMLLSLTKQDAVDFVPYNYIRLVVNNWEVLKQNSFTYRMLFDVVALSDPMFWNRAEYRLKAREVIIEVCRTWEIY